MNDENLIPSSKRSLNELREMTRKGGIRSGEVRRAKRTARQLAQLMLSCAAPDKMREQILRVFPEIDAKEIDIKAALLAKKIQNGLNGKSSDIDSILEIAGEMPDKKQQIDLVSSNKSMSPTQPDLTHLSYKELSELVRMRVEQKRQERESIG